MAKILVLYASVEGQTARIAERLGARLRRTHAVDVVRARDGAELPPLDDFGGVVVGASVHYGRHPGFLVAGLRSQRGVLTSRPSAFFSVSLSADGPGKNLRAVARYVAKFQRQVGWQAGEMAAFGGALRYSEYPAWKRFLVGLFVRAAGGDTDASRDYEYTDWCAVDRFADAFSASFPRA
jgi:menaquinone-dependent protoporphyrinogen oxidase